MDEPIGGVRVPSYVCLRTYAVARVHLYVYVCSLWELEMNAPDAATARTRARDPQATRGAILEAATEIIAEQGVAALTHRAVAARAGVALGSTTKHFASIADLRESSLRMLSDEIDASIDAIEEKLAAGSDIAETLAAEMREFFQDTRQSHAAVALFAAAAADPGLNWLATRWSERLAELLAPQVRRDQVVAIDVFLNGAALHAATNPTPLGESAVAAVLRAILAIP